MKVSLILGAGFSYNAGLPLVTGISEKFQQHPLYNFILNFNSGEWKWTEWANAAERNNGRLPGQHIPIAMIIETLITHFINDAGTNIVNYEKFYQFILDMSYDNKPRFQEIIHIAQANYKKQFNFLEYDFDSIPNSEIFSCFYHLIDDLLYVRKPFREIKDFYEPYLTYFQNENNSFNIYTLNHDLLLEKLFTSTSIPYNDGFSTANKILLDDNKNRIPVFDNTFGGRVNLIKLHGSIDIYQYRYNHERNMHKGYDYFKTMDFHAKHGATDVDEEGRVVQNWTMRITPQFITGQNKQQIIKEDKMYSHLYWHLQNNLPDSTRLIVIGYSFMDAHINHVIEAALPYIAEVIHINPYARFPFKHANITEINPINEEIKF